MSAPRPYYSDEFVTLYHGDCVEIIPQINADVLITDPPYGIGLGVEKDFRGGQHGLAKTAYAGSGDTYEAFVSEVVPRLALSLAKVKRAAVFTGPHIQEQTKATAIGGIYCPAGAGRHEWGFKTFLPVLFYGTAPELNKGARPNVIQSSATAEKNGHPCPKPLPWMSWLVGLASLPHEIILDPFAGSGTTLVAAKRMNRRAIGIERVQRYCDTAASRLAQSVLDFGGAA